MHHSYLDRFAHGHSPVHRLDARAKLVMVLAYTGVLVSFDRWEVSALVPMLVGPLAMLWIGGVPVWFALRRMIVVSPLVLAACGACLYYDRQLTEVALGPWSGEVSGGAITAADIAMKFVLGMLALTALTGTTPFGLLLQAMSRLRVPRALVLQLGLTYRYVFVLIDQALRMRRARDYRGARRAPVTRRLAAAAGVVGSLFVRTLDRGHRVHLAMQARGFTGRPRSLDLLRFRAADAVTLAGAGAYLAFCRFLYPVLAG